MRWSNVPEKTKQEISGALRLVVRLWFTQDQHVESAVKAAIARLQEPDVGELLERCRERFGTRWGFWWGGQEWTACCDPFGRNPVYYDRDTPAAALLALLEGSTPTPGTDLEEPALGLKTWFLRLLCSHRWVIDDITPVGKVCVHIFGPFVCELDGFRARCKRCGVERMVTEYDGRVVTQRLPSSYQQDALDKYIDEREQQEPGFKQLVTTIKGRNKNE